jgi:hypothetical protein
MTLPLSPEGAVSLPGAILWALSLNEGDLVAADLVEDEISRLRFRSYGRHVRSAMESCAHPWPFVEEVLRLLLAAVGPAGTLDLAGLGSRNPFQPGGSLLLRAEAGHGEPWFTLEPAAGWPALELEAHALYRLRVEAGFRVLVPEDALWALCLSEGSAVTCKTILNTLEGWVSAEDRLPGEVRLEVGPGGALPLPETLREHSRLQPGSGIRFEVHLSGASTGFRLAPDFSDLEGEDGHSVSAPKQPRPSPNERGSRCP